jgi:A/G-specific adenine glycosylase
MQNLAKTREKTIDGKSFTRLLLKWNRQKNNRRMPWKGEKNPYKIWLSEIILQQTRVEQGLDYYHRFIQKFPDIRRLANAKDAVIFKLWEGLGYYTRCRNLISTARFISKELDGRFPHSYHDIKELKGVGPYTAAAISSFAFNLPYAVVDGNVSRVLARVFGIEKSIDSTIGKKLISTLAEELLDKKQPGIYNQAIMDFGAVVCKPLAPLCSNCIFKNTCFAFLNDKVKKLPVKSKRVNIRKRWFYYFILKVENSFIIQQRKSKDIWNQLYEFPLIERKGDATIEIIIEEAATLGWLTKKKYEVVKISPVYKQQLSHQLITGRFIEIKLSEKAKLKKDQLRVTGIQLRKFPFPRVINQYLKATKGG